MSVYYDEKRGQYGVTINVYMNGNRVRRHKRLPRGISKEEAEKISEQMHADAALEASGLMLTGKSWNAKIGRALSVKGSWLHNMLKGARGRSKAKGREMTLTAEELADLLRESEGRCSVSGVPFSERPFGDSKMRPFSPSLDRRDCGKGYTKENCRIVCSAVNMAMYNWGEDIFRALATSTVLHSMLLPEMQKVLEIRTANSPIAESSFADSTVTD